MWERLRQHLLTWLNVPSPSLPEVRWDDLQAVQDRMDSLERMVMTHLQRPDEGSGMVPAGNDPRLSDQPDAHLGAQ
jgi:hypothetical protein